MTIFEKREWRKRRGISLTRSFWRREQTKERINNKIEVCQNNADRIIAKLRKQYDIVWRRQYER